jgi:cytochrome c5
VKNQIFANGLRMLGAMGLAMCVVAQSHALSEQQQADINERIKLVGTVCIEGDDSCAVAAAPAAASGPRSSEDIYNTTCMACHATGAAGAPKVGDNAAWAPRIAQGDSVLLEHAINGFKGMPAKGTCMSCSDDEIKATVEYMVKNSK